MVIRLWRRRHYRLRVLVQTDAPAVNNRGNVVKTLEEEVNTWLEGNLAQLRANQGYDCAIQPSRSVRSPVPVKPSFLPASDVVVAIEKRLTGEAGSVQPGNPADEDVLLPLGLSPTRLDTTVQLLSLRSFDEKWGEIIDRFEDNGCKRYAAWMAVNAGRSCRTAEA